MRAGRLRHRVAVEQPTDTRDAFGGNTRGWTEISERWASIEPLSGSELYEAQQVHARADVRIRMRYDPAITTRLRITHDGATYEIRGRMRNKRNGELELLCTEIDT